MEFRWIYRGMNVIKGLGGPGLFPVAGVVEEDFFAEAGVVEVEVDFGGGD